MAGTTPGRRQGEPRRPTLIDVAREAGVSRATASRVISGSSLVSPEARSRVLEAIDRIDYRVNVAARTLRTDRSSLVGLLIPGFLNDTFGVIAEQVDERLREHGLGLLIGSSGWDQAGDLRVLKSFESRRLDALILAPAVDQSLEFSAEVKRLQTPAVLLDRELPRLSLDSVLADHRGGMLAALGHLASLGHRRVGMAAYGDDIRPGREMRAGFRQGVAHFDLDPDPRLIVELSSLHPETGTRAARSLMELAPTACIVGGPTGVLAACLHELRTQLGARGWRMPQDMSVVAVGAEVVRALHVPTLTTVSRGLRDEGNALATMIVNRLASPGAEPRIDVHPMRLEIGQSTGAPRRKRPHDQ